MADGGPEATEDLEAKLAEFRARFELHPSAAELVARHGVVAAARRAAIAKAGEETPHPWVSVPLPADGGVGFVIAGGGDLRDMGGAGGALGVVRVEVPGLETRFEPWEGEPFSGRTAVVDTLPPAVGAALLAELLDAADRAAAAFLAGEQAGPAAARCHDLLRCVVPAGLVEACEQAAPAYIHWLSRADSGTVVDAVPAFDPAYLPLHPAVLGGVDADATWAFERTVLAAGCAQLGLAAREGSPLWGVPPAAPERFAAAVAGEPERWRDALATLAAPGWSVAVRGYSAAGRHDATFYVGRDQPDWVRLVAVGEDLVLSPGGPEFARALVLEALGADETQETPHPPLALPAVEAGRVLMLADAYLNEGERAFGRLPEGTAGPLCWTASGRTLGLPVAPARGWGFGYHAGAAGLELTSSIPVRELVRAMGALDAFAVLSVSNQTFEPARTVALLAARAGDRLWFAQPPAPQSGALEPDADVILFGAAPAAAMRIIGDALGLGATPAGVGSR